MSYRSAIHQFVIEMPKVELHVHLEGTVTWSTLRDFTRGNTLCTSASHVAPPTGQYQFRDFPHFIEGFIAVCTQLKTAAHFHRIVVDYGAELARQHVLYAELHVNPEPHVRRHGIPFPELLTGLNSGRDEVLNRWGVQLRWIFDGVRDAATGTRSVDLTVDWIVGAPSDSGIVALGLGGDEVDHPPEPFVDAFTRARAAGMHTVAHAGETTSPAMIWRTLEVLGVERIGHGLSALQDEILVTHLAAKGIPLEICPTSNQRTGLIASAAEHPWPELDAAGVRITLNSDDPALFGVSLTDEFLLAADRGYDADALQRLSLNAVDACFLPDNEKQALRFKFQNEFVALRSRLSL
ncbi:MAG: adenosine deaminase [Chloroflexia bacterium]|nr:adenosine deaminase [Chloroflexia bacterium]